MNNVSRYGSARGRQLALRHPRGRRLRGRLPRRVPHDRGAASHRLDRGVRGGFPDPDGDAGALDTVVFEKHDGVTTMTLTVLHAKQEHRDAHIASGMEGGMQISMNRLEDLVVELDRAA